MQPTTNGEYPEASFHTFLLVSFILLDCMTLSYTRLQWGKMILRVYEQREKKKTKNPKRNHQIKEYIFVV